jgi:flavin-dependent dehydrogenase
MYSTLEKITIVGGGTAGWLTAGIIAAEHSSKNGNGVEITLVESPDVSTIGVGEGTWPTMRETLRKMGISENEFFLECDASFKQASKFINWVSGSKDDFYYHPFGLPQGYLDVNLIPYWQSQRSTIPFADAFNAQSYICENGKAPKQIVTPEFAAVANYGYHLDAGKFAQFLQKHCTEKLGVKHILDHVTAINSREDGDIESLETKLNGEIYGDLFIDCSGFSALLIGKHFEIPFVSKKHILFNDTALAIQIPYEAPDSPIASATLSTAQEAGWIWDIGLPSRRGIGYVLSSRHTSDSEAEKVLRKYIEPSIGKAAAETASLRKITFNPGHREKFWHRNCVAIGMAAGFIEPLEASALVMVELSAAMISDELPATREIMDIVAKRFNEKFTYRWDRIVDFLKLHYVLSQRKDSSYWLDNQLAETIPDRLKELLTLWQYQPPSKNDFLQTGEIFTSASYQYVYYGMGAKTTFKETGKLGETIAAAEKYFFENQKLVDKFLNALTSNRELLLQLKNNI